MKRRVFSTEGAEYLSDLLARPVQVLVTFDPESDLIRVAVRPDSWDTWSRPMALVATDDDPLPPPGSRHYGDEGRGFAAEPAAGSATSSAEE